MDQPAVRGTVLKLLVVGLRQGADAPLADTALSALGDELVGEIDAASSVSWLPLELLQQVTERVARAVSPSAVRAWTRTAVAAGMDGPLLGPIARGSIRMFGPSPDAMFRFTPRAHGLVFRQCGELAYERAGLIGAVHWSEVPASFFQGPGMLAAWAGGMDACLELLERPWSTQLVATDPIRRHVCLEIPLEAEAA